MADILWRKWHRNVLIAKVILIHFIGEGGDMYVGDFQSKFEVVCKLF